MSLFFIGLILFAMLCLFVFVPFTPRQSRHKNYRQQKNIELYRQQMVWHPESEFKMPPKAQGAKISA